MDKENNTPVVTRRPFSCRRGSLTIRGYVFRTGTEVLPAIIICHGFMADQRSVKHYAEFLAGLEWRHLPSISAADV